MNQTLPFLAPGLPKSEYLFLSRNIISSMNLRNQYIADYGFCLFTAEVLAALKRYLVGKKVLEAGSGSGWLADWLANNGVDIQAADRADYRVVRDSYPMRKVYRLDHHGDVVDLLPGEFDVVILVWPNYNTDFGAKVIKAMKPGQVLIFEGEGPGGCTADDAFFDLFDSEFTERSLQSKVLNLHHKMFDGIHDQWSVLVKR